MVYAVIEGFSNSEVFLIVESFLLVVLILGGFFLIWKGIRAEFKNSNTKELSTENHSEILQRLTAIETDIERIEEKIDEFGSLCGRNSSDITLLKKSGSFLPIAVETL